MTATIGALKAGVDPATIVPRAAGAAGTVTTVEASDVQVVSGAARVVVRFTGDDDAAAHGIAQVALAELRTVVAVSGWRVTRRDGGRWSVI